MENLFRLFEELRSNHREQPSDLKKINILFKEILAHEKNDLTQLNRRCVSMTTSPTLIFQKHNKES